MKRLDTPLGYNLVPRDCIVATSDHRKALPIDVDDAGKLILQKDTNRLYLATLTDGPKDLGDLPYQVYPPSGLDFDFFKIPSLTVFASKLGGVVQVDFDHMSMVPAACAAAPLSRIIHVSTTGSSGNTGVGAYLGDFSNAKQSVASAITYGNSLGAAYQIIIAPGLYTRSYSWNQVVPTQEIAVIGWHDTPENRPVLSMQAEVTWAQDGTYTNTYKATRSAVIRVLDAAVIDSTGAETDLTNVESLETCNTTPNSWYANGTYVWVRRSDGNIPTEANTRVLLDVYGVTLNSSSSNVYVDGVVFLGGRCELKGRPNNTAAFVDCEFAYQGSYANSGNAIDILDYHTIVFVRCVARNASMDGFNVHKSGVNIPQVLLIDCEGRYNGAFGALNCQGLTSHDGVKMIDVRGLYHHNPGRNVVSVTAGTKNWLVGTKAHNCMWDGGTFPANFHFEDAMYAWLDNCFGNLSHSDIKAAVGATVMVKNHNHGICYIKLDSSSGAIITET